MNVEAGFCGSCRCEGWRNILSNKSVKTGKSASETSRRPRRQWRSYKTAAGNDPVDTFLSDLSDFDAAAVVAEMKAVLKEGMEAARHLRGEIYELRAEGENQSYRLLFAREGHYKQVLLALDAFSKKSQKCPPAKVQLAEKRLADWRRRGRKIS
jgi:phage-related protein